jgi:hypothetical protein
MGVQFKKVRVQIGKVLNSNIFRGVQFKKVRVQNLTSWTLTFLNWTPPKISKYKTDPF